MTFHAKDRAYEYGFQLETLKKLFKTGHRTNPPYRTTLINRMWHKDKHPIYKWNGGVLFTYTKQGPCDIILTVTPKKREDVQFA